MKPILIFLLLTTSITLGQEALVLVHEEQKGNRLAFYALNEDEKPYDVLFEVKGTNFRQSAAKPRLTRVPATSKVHLKTIILYRDKKPQYTYTLAVNDSLSRRALKKEFTIIEVAPKPITPKKHITVYTTLNCTSCDSIVHGLRDNLYIFKHIDLNENLKVKEALSATLGRPLDSLKQPIVNLGGHLYTWIKDYETLLSELEK
ncbi:MAG: hypothetical protein AAF039_01680 [Bacteroidota bacterium]